MKNKPKKNQPKKNQGRLQVPVRMTAALHDALETAVVEKSLGPPVRRLSINQAILEAIEAYLVAWETEKSTRTN